jgi:hypothetical protein
VVYNFLGSKTILKDREQPILEDYTELQNLQPYREIGVYFPVAGSTNDQITFQGSPK